MIKEEDTKIEIFDNKYLYAKLSGDIHQPLFIMVHGLAVDMEHDLYAQAVKWFSEKGYATLRFNLYGDEDNTRKMVDTTMAIHAEDIDIIVKHARQIGFKKIYIAGHSYGATSILIAKDLDVDKISLWDASYKISFKNTSENKDVSTFIEKSNGYMMHWPKPVLIGKNMADEAESLNWDILARNIKTPMQIIYAGNGYLEKGSKHYFDIANEPKNLVKIGSATHNFDDSKDVREKLFIETERWFSNGE